METKGAHQGLSSRWVINRLWPKGPTWADDGVGAVGVNACPHLCLSCSGAATAGVPSLRNTDACLDFRGGPSFGYTGLPGMPGCWSIPDAWSGRSLYTRRGDPTMETRGSPRATGLGTNTSHEQKPPTCKAAHFTLQKPDVDHAKGCPPPYHMLFEQAEDSGCFLPRSPPCLSPMASFPGPSSLAVSFCCAVSARLEQLWTEQL